MGVSGPWVRRQLPSCGHGPKNTAIRDRRQEERPVVLTMLSEGARLHVSVQNSWVCWRLGSLMKQKIEELWKHARIGVYIQRRWISKLREALASMTSIGRPRNEDEWQHFASLSEEAENYLDHIEDAASEIEAILGG